jgi:hypothetical protein
VGKHSAATPPPTWRFCRDLLTGRTTVKITNSSTQRINDTTVFEHNHDSMFQVAPDAPESANAQGRHVYRIVRPNHQIQSQADVAVQASANHFHLSISLEVSLNGAVKLTRTWSESIAREYL